MSLVFLPRVGGTIAKRRGPDRRRHRRRARAEGPGGSPGRGGRGRDGAGAGPSRRWPRKPRRAPGRGPGAPGRRRGPPGRRPWPTAEAGIRAAREKAMANVRTVAAETAEAIVEKLTGKPATAAEVDARAGRTGIGADKWKPFSPTPNSGSASRFVLFVGLLVWLGVHEDDRQGAGRPGRARSAPSWPRPSACATRPSSCWPRSGTTAQEAEETAEADAGQRRGRGQAHRGRGARRGSRSRSSRQGELATAQDRPGRGPGPGRGEGRRRRPGRRSRRAACWRRGWRARRPTRWPTAPSARSGRS